MVMQDLVKKKKHKNLHHIFIETLFFILLYISLILQLKVKKDVRFFFFQTKLYLLMDWNIS